MLGNKNFRIVSVLSLFHKQENFHNLTEESEWMDNMIRLSNQSNSIERNRTIVVRLTNLIEHQKDVINSIDFSVRLGSITNRLPFDSYIFQNLSLNSLLFFTSTLSSQMTKL